MFLEEGGRQVGCMACRKSQPRDGGGCSPTPALGLRELGLALWQELGLELARGTAA